MIISSNKIADTTIEMRARQTISFGFSLLELVVVVAITGVLLSIAAPNFSAFMLNSRISSETDKLFTAINQARQLAISNNTKGFLCRTTDEFSTNALDCTVSSVTSKDWHGHNYLTYSINTSNSTQRAALLADSSSASGTLNGLKLSTLIATSADRKEQVKSFENGAEAQSLTIKTNRALSLIAFNGDGTLFNSAPIRFTICDDRDDPEEFGRYIDISQSGRVRTATTNTTTTLNSCTPG